MAASLSVARKPSLLTRIAYGIGGAASGVKNNGFEYFLLLYYSQRIVPGACGRCRIGPRRRLLV